MNAAAITIADENIVQDQQPRSRQLTARAAAAAEEGPLYRNTIAASESNSRTHRDVRNPIPDPETDPVPAGQDGQKWEREMVPDVQALREWGRATLPTTRPSQVRSDGLRAQFGADNYTPHPLGQHSRAYQRARDRRRDYFDADSDGEIDSSYRPGVSYISLDDAKELFSHSMRQLSLNPPKVGGTDITRGITPKWEHGKDKFNHFEHKVELYLKRHKLQHLLTKECTSEEQVLHDQALLVITDQLPRGDQIVVRHMTQLHKIWDFMKQKYHPSIDADRTKLMKQWEKCSKGSRTVKEYHSEILSLNEQLAAHAYNLPRFLVLSKLLDCGKEFEIVRAAVETSLKQDSEMSYFRIMGEFVSYEQRLGLNASKLNPAGLHPRGNRGQGRSGAGNEGSGNVLAAKEEPETRHCFNCNQQGHLAIDCPKLSKETKDFLRKQKNLLQEHRRKRGSRRRQGGQ